MDSLPWADAWHTALYGPDGFYARVEGPAGHFVTSAQGIPGVAEILAQALLAVAESHAASVILDFACGRGELLTTMSQFAGSDLELMGVDIVERPAGLPPEIGWERSPGGAAVPTLSALDGRRALVVAHEWLDVVPCPVGEVDEDGVLRAVLVDRRGVETLGQPLELPEGFAENPPSPGQRVEFSHPRDQAWRALVDEVRRSAAPGSVVLGIDYTASRATTSPLGTLTGFRDGAECAPMPDGSCDITAHVLLDTLDLTAPPRTQRDVLFELFGDDAVKPPPHELARTDPPAYLERLALRSAFAAATARGGLGDFTWMVHEV